MVPVKNRWFLPSKTVKRAVAALKGHEGKLGPGGSEDVRSLVLQCGAGNRVVD